MEKGNSFTPYLLRGLTTKAERGIFCGQNRLLVIVESKGLLLKHNVFFPFVCVCAMYYMVSSLVVMCCLLSWRSSLRSFGKPYKTGNGQLIASKH